MNALLEDSRWKACLSAFRLDRFRLEELPPGEYEEVQAHLQSCPRCRAAAEMLASADAEFRASVTPLRRPRRTGRRVLVWGAGAAALAATCFVALQPSQGLRSKGAPVSLAMYVQHGQAVRRALPGEAVAPGDSVRFVYSSLEPRFLAILSVDGAGVASVYFPDGPEMVRVPAAQDAALPLATQLDGVLGEERVVALFCERPRALAPVREALQASRGALLEVPGCAVATFQFTKRAP
jgi:anti-sigma factor RsiW